MQSMRNPDPLVTSPRVHGRSIFSIIGLVVVGLVGLVLAYYAYVGWTSKGRPIPEVEVTTQPSALGRPALGGAATKAVAAVPANPAADITTRYAGASPTRTA